MTIGADCGGRGGIRDVDHGEPVIDGHEGARAHAATDDPPQPAVEAVAPTHDAAQASLNKWFIRTMNIFGRPNSPKNKVYRELGLKKRDNHDVRMTFAQEVADRCKENGLTLPEWKPDWDKLPMDAYVVG